MIYFINSDQRNKEYIFRLIRRWNFSDREIRIFSTTDTMIVGSGEEPIYLGPRIDNTNIFWCFRLVRFFLIIYYYFQIGRAMRQQELRTLICVGEREKYIFAPIAKKLGLRIIFLECPFFELPAHGKNRIRLYLESAKGVELIALGTMTKEKLINMGVAEANIQLVIPRSSPDQPQHQETIFSSLAKKEQSDIREKPFTIAVIIDLDAKHQLENLMRAICYAREVVRNLQLIVIGDGVERKTLIWLGKKLDINDLVWFVGEQEFLQRWIEGFDLYIDVASEPNIKNYLWLSKVISNKLAVIGFRGRGVEDYISDNENGFIINPDEPELLAQKIIYLQQNRGERIRMGRVGAEMFDRQIQMRDSVSIEKIVRR